MWRQRWLQLWLLAVAVVVVAGMVWLSDGSLTYHLVHSGIVRIKQPRACVRMCAHVRAYVPACVCVRDAVGRKAKRSVGSKSKGCKYLDGVLDPCLSGLGLVDVAPEIDGLSAPEAPNRSQHRIPNTNQHPTSMATKCRMAHGACGVGWRAEKHA